MPLYECLMVARIGEASALGMCLKSLTATLRSNGAVVRSVDNLGDRVLVKSLRANDGQMYSVGRFIKLELDCTPHMLSLAENELRGNDEVLRVNSSKIKESEYIEGVMKRINSELSPFRDKDTLDEEYIRLMWTKYTQIQALRNNSTPKKIAQDLPKVAAFIKSVEEGTENQDSQTL